MAVATAHCRLTNSVYLPRRRYVGIVAIVSAADKRYLLGVAVPGNPKRLVGG